jgi:transcriptional regulator with PAS, ATPase and Fis domain
MLYKLFFDMKKDVTELKRMFLEVLQNPGMMAQNQAFINQLKEGDNYRLKGNEMMPSHSAVPIGTIDLQPAVSGTQPVLMHNDIHEHVEVEESLNIVDKEKELILKALKKHKSKRKDAALDLGISERTLYRKLKEYDIEE